MKAEWGEEQYVTLTKLLNKFPGGTSNRWERIANDMDRPVAEIIKRTKDAQKKMHNFSAGGQNMYSGTSLLKTKKTIEVNHVGGISEAYEPTVVEEVATVTDEWTQTQQKLLELGMKKYGKDCAERWDKISEDVGGKDKVNFVDEEFIYWIKLTFNPHLRICVLKMINFIQNNIFYK